MILASAEHVLGATNCFRQWRPRDDLAVLYSGEKGVWKEGDGWRGGEGEGELGRGRENELELLPCKLFTTVPSRWEEGVLEGERV